MANQKTSKQAKKKAPDPLHRQIATLMLDLQDETLLLGRMLEKEKNIEQPRLLKLLILETKSCLEEFANKIQF